MKSSGSAVSLRLVAFAVVASSVLLGAGWITASLRDQHAREAIEARDARDALSSAERAVVARISELRSREDARPFYLYSHYYVPPDLLTLTDAIAVSPLADAQPAAPVIGWFQVDPDGTVRTPLSPEPSAAPTGLEARLREIALSPALASARASIVHRHAGGLVPHIEPAPAPTHPPPRPRARVTSRAVDPARTELARAEAVEASRTQAPLPVLMNQQANLLADDIQRAQAGDPESYARAAQSTQAAFVAQVVERAPPPASASVIPAQTQQALGRRAPPAIRQREAPDMPPAPSLPAVAATVDVRYEPMRWIDAGARLILARVVTSDLGVAPDEGLAVLQGVALDRAALLAWLRDAMVHVPIDGRRVELVDDARGCASSRTNELLPPGMSLCLREASSQAFAAEQRASIRTDLGLVVTLVLFVLLALLAIGRLARREAELAKQRSDFVTAVSHELRTPLTTLRMHAEMLEEGMVSPERMAKVFAELARESARMARLVDNVLEVSRLEAGRWELHPTYGDLSRAAAHIVEEHRAAAEARGMALTFASEGPVETCFDEAALERILANLIDNAVKYAEGSADPRIEVMLASAPGGALLSVRDHGPGIDVAERERVLERFHRVDRASDAHRPGTGLGLALVRELARAHGGDAHVDAAPGGGALVRVVLASLPAR